MSISSDWGLLPTFILCKVGIIGLWCLPVQPVGWGGPLPGFPGKSAYGSSKGAIMSFSYALRTELAGTAVKVCLVIPPPMRTDIVRNGLHIDETKRAAEMRFLERNGMPPEKAAGRILRKVDIDFY